MKKLYSKKYLYDKGVNLLNIDYSGNQRSISQQAVQANSNRLLNAEYDPSGNQLSTIKLSGIGYDHHNQTIKTSWLHHQEYYGYARAGQRVKKLNFSQNEQGKTTKLEMVFYLGQTEFRKIYTGQNLSFDGQTVYDNKVAIEASNDKVESRIKTGHGQVAKLSRDQIIRKQDCAYNLLNHIDNNTTVLNAKSKLVNFQHFYPYGGISYSYGNLGNKQLGFSGQELDDSELNYYGYRYYDSDRGRWTQPDPAGFKSEQLNLYAMLNGNPNSHRDSNGLGFLKSLFYNWLLFFEDLLNLDLKPAKTGDIISMEETFQYCQNFLVAEDHDFGFQYDGIDRLIEAKQKSAPNSKFGIYREMLQLGDESIETNDHKAVLNDNSSIRMMETILRSGYLLQFTGMKMHPKKMRAHWRFLKMIALKEINLLDQKDNDNFHFDYIARNFHQNTRKEILQIATSNELNKKNRINFFNLGLSHLLFENSNSIPELVSHLLRKNNHNMSRTVQSFKNSYNLLKTLTDQNIQVCMLVVSPNGLDSENFKKHDYAQNFEVWWEWWNKAGISNGGFYKKSHADSTVPLASFHPGYNIKVNSSILNNDKDWNKVKILSLNTSNPKAPRIFMINAVDKENRYEGYGDLKNSNQNKQDL